MDASLTAGADLLAIPDGADGQTVRIAIQVTPSVKVAGAIELAEWPARIASLAERVRIRIGTIAGDEVTIVGEIVTGSDLADFFDPRQQWRGKSRREAASAMWRDIFDPVGFPALMAAIGAMGEEVAAADAPAVASTRTSDLQLFLDTLADAQANGLWQPQSGAGPSLASIGRRIAGWMQSGPDARAAVPAALSNDPLEQRAEQLDRLRRSVQALASGAETGAGALTFAEDFEAELGGMFREHWTTLFGEEEPDPPVDEPETDDWGSTPAQGAARKLSGLLALPTLSHYLGLAVQVEIPRSALAALREGAIAAEFVDAAGTRIGGETAWTAFELDGAHFGPAPSAAAAAQGLYRGGFLNLGARLNPVEPRYALRSDDVVNTVHDLACDKTDDPNLKRRRRGLVVYDFDACRKLKDEEAAARALADASSATRINWLSELVVGYRPDIAVATHGTTSLSLDEERWRPVTARSIRCDHDELDPAFYVHPLILQLGDRDHAFAAALLEEKAGSQRVQDELFVWAGESLAIPADRSEATPVGRERDLGLRLTLALPDPAQDPHFDMPPLREGVGYACGCRLAYVNGGGPDFQTARRVYAADPSLVLGKDGRPFVYPAELLPAPEVHLGWEDPLVRADDPREQAAGEAVETFVIRDGRGKAVRFLTPPRTSFDGAELQGQFDDASVVEDTPPGALAGSRGLWLFGAEGKFPEARFGASLGGIRVLEGEMLDHVALDGRKRPPIALGGSDYEAIPSRQSRGTVAILGRRRTPATEAGPFYADGNGRRARATLERISLEGATGGPAPAERSFWKPQQMPADALPILLELTSTQDPAAFHPDADADVVDVDGYAVTLPRLRAMLPAGETYRLRLSGIGPRADNGTLDLRLVHAVERPLVAPDIVPKEAPDKLCTTAGLGINAITVTVRSEDPNKGGAAGLRSWAEKVQDYETGGSDMRCWPSEEGGTTTFFTGRVAIDRKSTGLIRCEAEWQEYGEATVSRNPRGGWIFNRAFETARLFDFEVERRGDEAMLDLLRAAPELRRESEMAARHRRVTGKPGALRALSHAFRDGRARELKVKMVAISAFTGFYPEDRDRPQGRDWISRFERQSNGFDDAPSVWAECTFRPPPPRIDRMLPLFNWQQIPGKRESARRLAQLRIYLDEGWFASGADERLGVVLLRDDKPQTVCAYEEGRLGAYQRFVSRAASDPVRTTAAVPLRLEPHHFLGAPAPVDGDLYLSEAGASTDPARGASSAVPPLPVRIIPIAPAFTPEDGLFCDLQLDIGPSYLPFLQLGLVRYQPHAVDHLRVSHPIEVQAQLLPERRLWVEQRPGLARRRVIVDGPGFEAPALGQPAHLENAMRLSVLSWDGDTREWRQSKAIVDKLEPRIDPASRSYHWQQDFALPLDGSDQQEFILVAEEFERLPLDQPTGRFANGKSEFTEADGERLTFCCLQRMRFPQ